MSRLSFFGLAIGVFVLDQVTKHWVIDNLYLDTSRTVIPHVFYLTRTTNTGGAFGLFPYATGILALTALLAVAGIIYYALRAIWPVSIRLALSLALPLGGAAGNFLDRVRLGRVIDFLDLRIGTYNWPIFNVADSAICIGVCILAFSLLAPSLAVTCQEQSTESAK